MTRDLLRAGRELYGLELVKSSGGALKRGTISVTLGRMAETGYVTSRQQRDVDASGMPRRIYKIRGEGARVLGAVDAARAAMDGCVADV
ncbi:MAG: hypothetical protein AAGC82_03055 [Pseudomonadota bacterium]